MSKQVARRNRDVLRWVYAVGYAVATWAALIGLKFRPASAAPVLALAVGAISLLSTEVGTAAFVLIVAIPLLAANALVGLVFLVAGLAFVQYLGGNALPVLLLIAAAIAVAVLGPVWAIPVLAGYILGSFDGAIAAFVACAVLEVAGIVLGGGSAGHGWSAVMLLGGARPLIQLAGTQENLLTFGWLGPALKSIGVADAKALWSHLSGTRHGIVLLLQPVAWALAATVAGRLRRPSGDPLQPRMAIVSSVAGVGVLALASAVMLAAFGVAAGTGAVALAALVSVFLAAAGAFVWDRFFAPTARPVARAARPIGQRGLASDDADVDELLRLIASAEDKIATKHTTHTVVMITDMKSFSRMTEEEGSFVTAKAVQRHRDLLIPVIEARGGKGKSTGGDGLIASFSSAHDAACAAIEMQQKLEQYNAEHSREREILVRIGIADGEVVLDKGGRPFIGAALNLAARVMSLGDGGQILVTSDIGSQAKGPDVRTESHGPFELKNIAAPVEVLEVLWKDGQVPCDPRTFLAPKTPEPQPSVQPE